MPIQPLRPYMKFIDDTGVLTKDGYDFLFNLYNRVNGGSSGVDADTLESKTWEAPGTIGSSSQNTAKFTSLSTSGQYTNTVGIGTAPFIITSTTNIPNLNASSLSGATFAAPGAIGGGTASAGTFTGLTATGVVTLTSATPGALNNVTIGAVTALTGRFTTVTATGAFGCNTKTAQTAFASGGAVTTTAATNVAPFGYSTGAQADAIITLLNNIRSALVANGIMS